MVDLNGRIALVTGASRGIGKAVAVELARNGADVALNFIKNSEAARQTLDTIVGMGRRGIIIQADVSKGSDISRMVGAIEAELGPLDILVNNAAIAKPQAIDAITESDWNEVIGTNLTSVFLVTQAVLPGMRKRRWGRIINISSGAAQTGGIVGLHYTAAKAGVEGLTRAYAAGVVKEGITVNAVAPSLIETDMIRDLDVKKLVPMGRLGRPEEVAEAVVFLAGNAYTTGQTLYMNGGRYFR